MSQPRHDGRWGLGAADLSAVMAALRKRMIIRSIIRGFLIAKLSITAQWVFFGTCLVIGRTRPIRQHRAWSSLPNRSASPLFGRCVLRHGACSRSFLFFKSRSYLPEVPRSPLASPTQALRRTPIPPSLLHHGRENQPGPRRPADFGLALAGAPLPGGCVRCRQYVRIATSPFLPC